jgi:tRNA threonylcarbamoyladenosine biosynthesis protein TsaB
LRFNCKSFYPLIFEKNMSYILSIETSTKVCSIALHQGSSLLSSAEVLVEKSHSKIITGLIDVLLQSTGLEYSQLNAVAVSKGPGSYTGLRIGVSTAKGLCYGLNIPLIAINTLEAMAYEVNKFNPMAYNLCPMLDARRMEVYCALINKENTFIQETQAKVIDENSFSAELESGKVLFFGDGALKTQNLLSKSGNAFFLDGIYPSAKNIGYLAFKSYEEKKFEDLIYFEPFYLKDFISTGKVS